tara:strand:- start:743 stop:1639 length:897 start_codon:yes stop_codon:yes gene_type:complete
MLERSHLAIIAAVDARGTLTEAATSLHLSQSALSHAIRKLENQLGTPLWQKEGRLLRLTQAGEQLLQLAKRLLPQFEHAEQLLRQYARGQRGTLRIGMECHPCYQWLLKVIAPFLELWPDVDVDVKQKFQFGGIGALFSHDIDILVTPDPLRQKGLDYTPVFDYEQVLVVAKQHVLATKAFVRPEDLCSETLISYPVERERLDIYAEFLTPAKCAPREHKEIEATNIMLQMVAAGRGVAALPRWLVEEHAQSLDIHPVRLGSNGIAKQIFLGVRRSDEDLGYLRGFIDLADSVRSTAI